MDALKRISEMSPEEIHAIAHKSYLAKAKEYACVTLTDPYKLGGRGSVLEMELAYIIMALLEELHGERVNIEETLNELATKNH